MKQKKYIVLIGLCICMAGCGNGKKGEDTSSISSGTEIEMQSDNNNSMKQSINETVTEHLVVQTDFQNSYEQLPSYNTELKHFDTSKVCSIIWPGVEENDIQKEEMDDKSVVMEYEEGVLSVNAGTLLYRKNNDTTYYDTLLSYASKENISEEKDLEFMTKEEAENKAEEILTKLEIGGELETPTVVCASRDDLDKIQDEIRNDEDYSSILNAKQIEGTSFDNTSGFYYFQYDFSTNSLPIYGSDDPSVQMMGDMEQALLAYPMKATIIITDTGIEEIQLTGVSEQLDENAKKSEIMQYEGIREALNKKYGDVILTDDYKVVRIWMEYFPLIKSDSFNEIELIPVWCCDFEINGEKGLDYTIRFNAFTGDEIA